MILVYDEVLEKMCGLAFSLSNGSIEATTSMRRTGIGARASIGTEMGLTGNPSIMTLPTGTAFQWLM